MHVSLASVTLTGLSCLSALALAVPTNFSFADDPTGEGFPSPNAQQLMAIEAQAQGSLPNGPSPSSVKNNTVTSLQLIAFNEIFETAFFTSLIQNITNNVTGYAIANSTLKNGYLEALVAIRAQEELHTLFANNSLTALGAKPVQTCKFMFPVTTLPDAIALASKFTDIVLGTLPAIQQLLAMSNDSALIPGIGSVIGQEGEQNGAYRIFQNKIPSALPFLTAGTREFAFSALNQNFIVPGSCAVDYINLPIFKPLTVVTNPIAAKNQTLSFEVPMANGSTTSNASSYSLAYVNQQNIPVIEPLRNVTANQTTKMMQFNAAFPYNGTTFGNGFTYALVVNGSTTGLTSAADVAAITVYGPGLIEIN
ncbi:hypothetical protein LSUB1_G002213 [Lachnellula subtilissima]|uniref:Sexual development protein n=1 Tax=Lachnellula subtilissima TaxID=602034 RepID=A0A8H8RVS1_9HELO|nr:hypothetical protein LSUB1_G002213 [Lachnellula subtilissima]